MSDGAIVLGAVFALALVYSSTRIVIALIGQRAHQAPDAARLTALEREVADLRERLEQSDDAITRLQSALGFQEQLLTRRGLEERHTQADGT